MKIVFTKFKKNLEKGFKIYSVPLSLQSISLNNAKTIHSASRFKYP